MLSKLLNKFLKSKIYNLHQEYEKSQWLNRKELENLQLKKLKKLLEYTYKNVPFYKNLWDKNNIDYKINNLDNLKLFPIVNKTMLQNAIVSNEISKEYLGKLDTKEIVWQATTGSSGQPFKFPVDINSENHKNALRRRLYKWYGINYDTKWAKFWRGSYKKSLKEKLKEYITGQYRFCIYDPKYPKETELNDKRIEYFINELNSIRPEVLDGFPSALREIAKYILTNDIKLDFTINSIVTGAEVLTKDDRNLISKAFGTVVFNRYGGTESSIIAHECDMQTKLEHKLHIQEDRLIVENSDDNEIIFTDLTSYALPFIRYSNGDIGKINEDYICSCGRVFKILNNVDGRVNDMFILPDGGKITSHIWQNYMKKCSGIETYQMIQEDRKNIFVNWIKNTKLFKESDLKIVKKSVSEALNGCAVVWNEVEKIDVGIGGKFRQHICKVKN
jgi:phenylacetate-CoA ligase